MLILRRKSGESIVISDNIILTVLDINEGSVRLAIEAPKEIPILRSELLQAADANRDSAAAEKSPLRDLFGLLGERRGAARPARSGPRQSAFKRAPAPPQDSGPPAPSASDAAIPAPTDSDAQTPPDSASRTS